MGENNAPGVVKVAYRKRCSLEKMLCLRREMGETDKGRKGIGTMKDGVMSSHLERGAQAEF